MPSWRSRTFRTSIKIALLLFVLLVTWIPRSICLRIEHLWVPEAMANDSVEYAILDCDYSLDERDKDSLEVKWYFRYDPTPIYQWVPPNDPQVYVYTITNQTCVFV